MFQSSCAERACVGATYLLVLVLCVACNKADETNSSRTTSPVQEKKVVEQNGRVEPAIVACNLITSDEVGEVQKATITEVKGGAGPSGGLVMSQCYYTAKESNMSVSLAVIQPGGEGRTRSEARDYWGKTIRGSSEQFGGETQGEDRYQKSERGEEEEKKNPPKKIDGVGDEAFWSGNRFGGALYVLKGDVFIRISVGGPDNETTKIEKSKELAKKALARLP